MALSRIIQHSVITPEKKGVGESTQFKSGCFHSRVCVSDVGWWGKAEGTDK